MQGSSPLHKVKGLPARTRAHPDKANYGAGAASFQLGIEPEGGPTEDVARTITTEIPLWSGVARANHIKAG